MIDNLLQFVNTDLRSASLALLDKLGMKYTLGAKTPLAVSDLFKGKGLSKAATEALNVVTATYFVALIDNRTFDNSRSQITLDSALDEAKEDKYNGMFVFAIDIKPKANITRSIAAVLTRTFNKLAVNKPMTLLIRQTNYLSIATCERSNYSQSWREGEKLGKVSLLRNVDCVNTHQGHIRILKELECGGITTFDKLYEKWQKVFNTSVLTKQFYDDLFNWFQWAVDKETHVSFPGDVSSQDCDRKNIDDRVIRLITRLMFVWFIKQKGLVPESIFDADYLKTILKDFDPNSSTQCNYYQAILQNLFFGTLNRPIIEDGERREFAKSSSKDTTNLYRYSELFSIPEQEVIDLFSTVPFLNCALFECQDKCKTLDGVEKRFYNDGFSRQERRYKDGTYMYRAVVPNNLFFDKEKGILSIFNRYVFTIEENTPQDVQVALDPELLGKVFENLLGFINPETHDTARNESGSFYTPREIVQYMVNESLVAHLKQTVGEELEEQYRQLLDFTTETVQLTAEQRQKIIHSLFTCKILDPACGSGAFPMGMLQQMVHILQQVDPDNTQWRDVLLNMAVDESRRAFGIVDEEERKKKLLEIEETFNNGLNSPDYTRKLYIIESCIYGVDIQPIAMLITRLRFFITLICEQTDIQLDKPEQNFGIKTLPNLESKFVAANSLLNADIHKYNEDWTQDEVLTLLKNELIAIRHHHFYTRKRSAKIRLLKEDEAKRKQIHEHINRLVGEPNETKIKMLQQQIAENEKLIALYQGEEWVEEAVQTDLFSPPQVMLVDKNKRERERINGVINACRRDIEREQKKSTPQGFEAAVLQVTDWNPYDQNSVAPFLDIEWMFGVTDGFDIVIGNPPYIQLELERGKLANLYEPCGYQTFDRKGNIFCLFYERGWQLLHSHGVLCYITLNKWIWVDYGKKLRSFLTSETNPSLFLNFGGVQVFESATVDTNILLFYKGEYTKKTLSTEMKVKDLVSFSSLDKYVANNHTYCQFEGDNSWIIVSDLTRALKKKVEAAGKPLKDWDIQINYGIKTGYNPAFIIDTSTRDAILADCNDAKEKERTKQLICPMLRGKDIQKYGHRWNTAGKYLINSHNGVRGKYQRIDIEKYPATKSYMDNFYSKLAKRYDKGATPYNLRNCAYLDEFSKPKIMYPNMTKFMPFYYDENGFFSNDKSFILTGKHLSYLTAFFNSSLFKYCFIDNFPPLREDTRELRKTYFDKIPVLEVSDTIDDKFRELVLDIQKEYSDDKAKAIDQRIFDLYGLTKDERDAIGYIDFHSDNDNETDDDE